MKFSLGALKRLVGTCHQKDLALTFDVAHNHPDMAFKPSILKLCDNGRTTTIEALSFAIYEQERRK